MNVKQLSAVIEGIAPVIRKFVKEHTDTLATRMKVLEDRLAAREASLAERVQQLDDLRREVAELRGRTEQ